MKKNIVKMSLVTAMLLSTGAYAGKIIGADISGAEPVPAWEPDTQFGFGGWDLSKTVTVKITDLDFNEIDKTFDEEFGTYDTMEINDTFESELYGELSELRGLLHGKDWPVGEPAGIKVINGDMNTSNGKPENCIMTTSYLSKEKNNDVNGLLNSDNPEPVICSSPFQSHKRFKVNMLETTVGDYNTTTGYGKPFYLAFHLDPEDLNTEKTRYQVFQKINNYTGMRLDGYKIEVLDGNSAVDENLTLSIGLDENIKGQGEDAKISDIWDPEDMANFSHGLWGPQTYEDDPHFPIDGFFDNTRAGFVVAESGHNTPTLVAGPTTLDAVAPNNYDNLFGIWLPSKWAPKGIFFDDDDNPLTDAELIAFWGTVPDAPRGTLPAWHKGKDYDLSDGDQSWEEPTLEEFLTWVTDPLYDMGVIEDTLNLGLNYIVNIVGDNTQIGDSRVVLRFTPRVAVDQTPPNYIDDQGNYILPVTDYNGTDPIIVISPAPLFDLDADLSVGVADTALNTDPGTEQNVTIVITTTSGDEENLTLEETDVNSSIFVGTIGSDTNTVVVQDGNVSVVNGTVVTATYGALTATTTATDGTVTPPVTPPTTGGGGGGGCTYNPNSKNFDMTFLMLMALGMLYPFRRRFLK